MQRRSLFQLAGAAALLRKSLTGQTGQATPAKAPARRPGQGGYPEDFPALDRRFTSWSGRSFRGTWKPSGRPFTPAASYSLLLTTAA